MEMINSLTGIALDSQKFVDAIKAQERQVLDTLKAESYKHETRTQRRARERAEAKAARRAKV